MVQLSNLFDMCLMNNFILDNISILFFFLAKSISIAISKGNLAFAALKSSTS